MKQLPNKEIAFPTVISLLGLEKGQVKMYIKGMDRMSTPLSDMFIDQNILIQVQNKQISTGKAVELLRVAVEEEVKKALAQQREKFRKVIEGMRPNYDTDMSDLKYLDGEFMLVGRILKEIDNL